MDSSLTFFSSILPPVRIAGHDQSDGFLYEIMDEGLYGVATDDMTIDMPDLDQAPNDAAMHEEPSTWDTGTAQPSSDAALGQVDLRLNRLCTPVLELDTLERVHFGKVLPSLECLVPQNLLPSQLQLLNIAIGDNIYLQDYFKLLIVGITNNLSGINELPSRSILAFLTSRFDRIQVSRALDSLHKPVCQAFSETLLKCAVSVGKASVVDVILSREDSAIDVNGTFQANFPGTRAPSTLLELAIAKDHMIVAKTLLKHGADVNVITEASRMRSPRKAIVWYKCPSVFGLKRFLQFATILVEDGRPITAHEVLGVFEGFPGIGDISDSIERLTSPESIRMWSAWERLAVLFLVVLQLRSSSAMKIAKRILSYHVELNTNIPETDVGIWIENSEDRARTASIERCLKPYPFRIVDAAARRGNLSLLKVLLEHGAHLTVYTLPHAVMSGSECLIQYLMERIAVEDTKFDLISVTSRTDWADLINTPARKGNLCLVKQLRQRGASITEHTLAYAIKSENHCLVEYLIQEDSEIERYSDGILDELASTTPEILNLLEQLGTLEKPCRDARNMLTVNKAIDTNNLDVLKDVLRNFTIVYNPFRRFGQTSDSIFAHRLAGHLIEAIDAGMTNIALALIDGGSCVGSSKCTAPKFFEREPTPLISALQARNPLVIDALLDAGACPSGAKVGNEAHYPLHLALVWGEESIVRRLVYAGASVNASWRDESTREEDLYCHLSLAVSLRNSGLIVILLENGADPEGRGGVSPLEAAVQNNDNEVFQLLLAHGANPANSQALLKAVLRLKQDWVRILLETFAARFPNGKPGYGCSALYHAMRNGQTALVHLMISYNVGAPLSGSGIADFWQEHTPLLFYEDNHGFMTRSPLAVALGISGGSGESVVSALMNKGVDPNGIVSLHRYSGERYTALLECIRLKNLQAMEVLISFGADINWPAKRGLIRTPLQYASELGHVNTVRFLIKHGADANNVPAVRFGATALQLAAIGGFVGIAEMLVENGAYVNGPTAKINGRSAIAGAAEHGRLHMVEFLLYHGAMVDPTGVGYHCEAITLAERNGHMAVARVLRSHLDDLSRLQPAAEMPSIDIPKSVSNRLECHQCDLSLATNFTLRRHLQEKHALEADAEIEEHECETCGRTFRRKSDLKRHISTHTKEDYVECSSCGRLHRKDYKCKRKSKRPEVQG